MTAILTFYVLRLFSMQIIEGRSYLAQANANKTREVSIATQRGILYDRNGIVLARNVASYNVVITPAGLPDIDLLNPNGDVQRIVSGIICVD